jgi:hypothetical protein
LESENRIMNTDVIRRKLRDFRTRAATIAELSETGEAKIDEITPLLQDRHEGVRWSAIRILSEIADLRAVGPLLSLLEQEKNVSDVALALESITGQTFGDDLLAWKQWAMQTSDCPTESIPNLLSDAELIAAATEDLPVTVSGSGLEFSVSVKLDEGRSQQIWVDFSHQDCETEYAMWQRRSESLRSSAEIKYVDLLRRHCHRRAGRDVMLRGDQYPPAPDRTRRRHRQLNHVTRATWRLRRKDAL